jgi:hypothetical protein
LAQKPPTEVHEKTGHLPALAVGGGVGDSSFIGGVEVGRPQAHGGVLRDPTPEARSKGGRVTAERRARMKARSEEIEEAMVGHVERMNAIIGRLMEEAEKGEQHRCQCGRFGPKVSKLTLKEATEVAATMMRAVKGPDTVTTVVPIQVNVVAGGPVTPNLPPDRSE